MAPERLSSLDASFLYLERPAMHMHVAGVSVLEPRADGPLTYDDVQRVVEARLHLAPRLRQRVMRVPADLARPLWVDDDRFDLDFHLRRSAIPSPGGRLQLERSVGRVLSRPLDVSKPLWELYVFEGLADGRTAVLLKLHHALADGISGMLIASALFDLEPDAPLGPAPKRPWQAETPPSSGDLVRDAMEDLVLHPLQALDERGPGAGQRLGVRQRDGRRRDAHLRDGRPPARAVRRDDRSGPTVRDRGDAVRAICTRSRAALGGTINDVVLAAVAGGLHRLLAHRGEESKGRTLRVMVPVSVRRAPSRAMSGTVSRRRSSTCRSGR